MMVQMTRKKMTLTTCEVIQRRLIEQWSAVFLDAMRQLCDNFHFSQLSD